MPGQQLSQKTNRDISLHFGVEVNLQNALLHQPNCNVSLDLSIEIYLDFQI